MHAAREEKLSSDSDSDSASSATAGLESELGYELTWDSIQVSSDWRSPQNHAKILR